MKREKLEPTRFSVVVNPSKPSTYALLRSRGAPEVTVVSVLTGRSMREKVKRWLQVNWTRNMDLTNLLLTLNELPETGDYKTLFARNPLELEAMLGVTDFINQFDKEIEALRPILQPTTLAGTPFPTPSTVFNGMSYAERQKYAKPD